MSRFFAQRRPTEQPAISQPTDSAPPSSRPLVSNVQTGTDNLAADLMQELGQAIHHWKSRNRLENLPTDVVLNQAIMALETMLEYERQRRDMTARR